MGGATAPNSRINFGVIGAGGQGNSDMGNILANPLAQVIAVCDVDPERRAKTAKRVNDHYAADNPTGSYKGCSEYADMRELLARDDIDAVLITTPDHWHCLAAVYAANAGKHIYCEKPCASSIPEGRAMVEAIQRSGVVCQIGSQQRSSGEFQRAIDLARNGFLGKVTRVQVGLPGGMSIQRGHAMGLAPERPPAGFDYERWVGPAAFVPYYDARCHWNWRWSFNFAGGQLTDWIGHHFDIAAVAMGVSAMGPVAIRNASAEFAYREPLFDTATDYSFEAHYANGVVIEVASKTRGGLRIEGTDGWVFANRGIIEHSSEALRNLAIPAQGLTLGRGVKAHMDNFIDCIRTLAQPRCPVNEAHSVASVGHLANIAFRSGRSELKWDPVKESLIDAPEAERFLLRTYRAPWSLNS
jgi:predicted dehydrogenase